MSLIIPNSTKTMVNAISIKNLTNKTELLFSSLIIAFPIIIYTNHAEIFNEWLKTDKQSKRRCPKSIS